tara:strand:+ start:12450 stop:12599 length:150 start_codon:yes stop_codon:yes gene_type:complete
MSKSSNKLKIQVLKDWLKSRESKSKNKKSKFSKADTYKNTRKKYGKKSY